MNRWTRWSNRALKIAIALAVTALLSLAVFTYLYENARVDAIIEGHQSLQQAEIDSNGLTIQSVLKQGAASYKALQATLAQLHATDAAQQAEITALQAQLASLPSQSPSERSVAPPPGRSSGSTQQSGQQPQPRHSHRKHP